jgi:hypothetical protein
MKGLARTTSVDVGTNPSRRGRSGKGTGTGEPWLIRRVHPLAARENVSRCQPSFMAVPIEGMEWIVESGDWNTIGGGVSVGFPETLQSTNSSVVAAGAVDQRIALVGAVGAQRRFQSEGFQASRAFGEPVQPRRVRPS